MIFETQKDIEREERELREQFFEMCWKKTIHQGIVGTVKKNFVRELFIAIMDNCVNKIREMGFNPLDLQFSTEVLESGKIIEQIYFYHTFHTSHLSDEERSLKQKDNDYRRELIGQVTANIITGSLREVKVQAATSANSPEIIAFKIYANEILAIASYGTQDGKKATVIDALMQYVSGAIKSIVELLANGYGGSAVTLWRQLHEQECTLIALLKGGSNAGNAYLAHQRFYSLELEENKELEAELESELVKYKLEGKTAAQRARNQRNYINYGWLLTIEAFKNGFNNCSYRLDFKNGLEAFSEQNDRFTAYADASKIIHSSSRMLSITSKGYYVFVLQNLYSTVIRLTPWLLDYIDSNYEKTVVVEEFHKFIDVTLMQLDKNAKVISEKYPRELVEE